MDYSVTASLCSIRVTCIIAAVGLSVIPLLQDIGSYNNVAAQSEFRQNVLLHIDKGTNVIGNYGVIISNDRTGLKLPKIFTDTENSPQNIVVPGAINAFDGDTLIACAMIMDTREIACDSKFANQFSDPLEFNIDMTTAQQLSGGGGGVDQFQP